MKKTRRLFAVLTVILLSLQQANAYEKRTWLEDLAPKDKLPELLVTGQKWVDVPAYADRAGWDDLMGEWKQKYIKYGEDKLNYKWQVVTAQMYMEFCKSGNRTVMERPYSDNRTALGYLFLAELAEGKGRFIPAIIDGVFYFCEMTSWALSAHIPHGDKKLLPDYRENTVELVSGDLCSLLGWVYYYLHEEFDKVDPVISQRLKAEMEKRIFKAYLTGNYWWVAIGSSPNATVNNWNPWCNFNVLQSIMLVADENDKQLMCDVVSRTIQSVDEYLSHNYEDGCCDEGTSYWSHAAGKLMDYLRLLSMVTDKKVSIFDKPMIRNMGEYISRSYVGDGWVVNFADASARGGGDPAFIYTYGKETGSQEMMQYAASLGWKKSFPTGTDLFRIFNSLKTKKEMGNVEPGTSHAPCTWYPQTQVCYLRNNNEIMLAAKGGTNGESHNHNDVGNFSMWLQHLPVFIDAGVGTYTRQTFSGERYKIWTMQSEYHNLPKINGIAQAAGLNYKAANTTCDEKKQIFSTDIAGAYPKEAQVKSWIRSYQLKNKKVIITDKFQLSALSGEPNLIRFMTWKEPEIKDELITLNTDKGKVTMRYSSSQFSAEAEPIKQEDPHLSNVWGEYVYRITLKSRTPKMSDTYTYTIEVNP